MGLIQFPPHSLPARTDLGINTVESAPADRSYIGRSPMQFFPGKWWKNVDLQTKCEKPNPNKTNALYPGSFEIYLILQHLSTNGELVVLDIRDPLMKAIATQGYPYSNPTPPGPKQPI